MKNSNPIPPQRKGSFVDVIEEIIAANDHEAKALFTTATQRLLAVNEWGKYAGISEFRLFDKKGNKLERPALEGDFIRIDIPGPGTKSGRGYDWVNVESIVSWDKDGEQVVAMQVRPVSYPLTQNNVIAHFLDSEATSTFIVRRRGLVVCAEEHGRNELPNTKEGALLDRGRNFLIGMAAKLGMSYPQWKSLVQGLLNKK